MEIDVKILQGIFFYLYDLNQVCNTGSKTHKKLIAILCISNFPPHILENKINPGILFHELPAGKCPWKSRKRQKPGETLEIYLP